MLRTTLTSTMPRVPALRLLSPLRAASTRTSSLASRALSMARGSNSAHMVPNEIELLNKSARSAAQELDAQYVLGTYARNPLHITHGSGAYLYDHAGREYLDFCAGIAVNALGTGDAGLTRVIAEQAGTLMHTSNLYTTEPQALLAERLVKASPASLSRVFFANSGTEANEATIKFARKVVLVEQSAAVAARKTRMIAFEGCFHGRSLGSLAVTAKAAIREPFHPILAGAGELVTFVPYNDVARFAEAMDDDVSAVIIEPVQGEGGVTCARPELLRAVRELCNRHSAMMILDEVQCGVGRTGRLFAHETILEADGGAPLDPDMLSLAKPLAGGLPIGAVLVSQRVANAVKYGDHGSTFAGNPLVCAAANYVLDRIADPAFLANVRARGDQLRSHLERIQLLSGGRVTAIRGAPAGLMAGIGLADDIDAGHVANECALRGLLVPTAGLNTVRLVPPLIVNAAQIDRAAAVLADAIAAVKPKETPASSAH
jgi:predicted acetylornithine/succinylornithine family transaminase